MSNITVGLAPVWKAHCENVNFPALEHDIEVDVAIIGGGITGITCAHYLAESGRKVAVLEAWKIGEGTTGYSTGNLYAMVDERLFKVKSKFDKETADKVSQSRYEALALIENNISQFNIECDFSRQPWYLFTNAEAKVSDIEKEYASYSQAGFMASLSESLPLSFPTRKVVRVAEQAQFNPMRYIKKYASAISSSSCLVYEHTPVTDIDYKTYTLKTPKGNVKAKEIVHATHIPKGFTPVQALLGPYREYGIAMRLHKGNYPPGGIFWHLEEGHHHSFRTYETAGVKYLIVVGAPHKVGHEKEKNTGFEDLVRFAHQHFGDGELMYKWAAQHYRPADSIPYVGKILGQDRAYYATGYSTDGLIYGTLCGKIVADLIDGATNTYSDLYDANRVKIAASANEFIKENADVAWHYIKDLASKLFSHPGMDEVEPGHGKVVDVDNKKWAVYKDEQGEPHAVSAVCPHLACIVNWNATERTWDCPCHGSRFTIDGEVIEGPAISRLKSLEEYTREQEEK